MLIPCTVQQENIFMFVVYKRLEYRMLIDNVYREIVQSPQDLTKMSTCT